MKILNEWELFKKFHDEGDDIKKKWVAVEDILKELEKSIDTKYPNEIGMNVSELIVKLQRGR